jgi:hypothetical protein
MRQAGPFSEMHKESVFLCLGKKSRDEVSNRAKNCSFSDDSVSKTAVFLRPKHVEVFHTSLFYKLNYYENT